MSAILKALIATLLVGGCASNPAPVKVRIAPDLVFSLPSLVEDTENVEAAQVVFGDAGPVPIQFQSYIRRSRGEVVVVMVDPLGRRGMEIRWDREGVTSEAAPWIPKEVRPLNILADIVIAHWPASDVRAGLVGTEAQLRETANARVISRAGSELMRIDYDLGFVPPWSGALVVRNLALGYTLEITSTHTGP